MNAKIATVVLFSGMLFACAPPPAPAAPEAVHNVVTIRAASCRTVLSLSEEDRASASMFYIGYTSSRRHQAKIDVAEVSGIEAAALGYCAAYPDWPAATAFNKAFADNGR